MFPHTIIISMIVMLPSACILASQDTCSEDEKYCSALPLHQVECQEIGTNKEIDLEGHTTYIMKTVSQKPKVFEIEHFLTDEECEHFIRVAEAKGLQESKTYSHWATTRSEIVVRDTNKDKLLSLDEMMLTLEDSYDIYFNEEDILLMYKKLNIDRNGDNQLTPEELGTVQEPVLRGYVEEYVKKHPHKRSRYSKQIWLYADGTDSQDPVFNRIQDRVQKLTQLHPTLIKKSDFQVVSYGKLGHYNAHHDSSFMKTEVPCCTRKLKTNCRICRFATVLFYLNDVEGGGETAFPIAGNDTYDGTKFLTSHQQNLMRHCQNATLRVFPQKGKAVLWYNHRVNDDTGWVGDLDPFTWHGGCPVEKGHKWIANFWIKFTDDPYEML